MHFRYKDPEGRVVSLRDVSALAQAIRNGAITAETPLAIGDDRHYHDAGLVVAYQQAAVGLERNSLGTAQGGGAPVVAPGGIPRRKLWLLLGAAAAALMVGVLLLNRRAPERGSAPVAVVAGPAAADPEMRVALRSVVTEFADSVGVLQRRLEDWVQRQRFDQRLRGSALLAPASLRAVRVAAESYRAHLDTLVAEGERLAVRLGSRADSLESMSRSRNGLLAATQDALAEWTRNLGAYTGLERAIAFATDSLAAFLLQRQQSFVLREGQPVFLSRDDAGRVRTLERAIEDAAQRERRWAEEALEQNPGWLTALAPADRPAFHALAQRSNQ